MQKLLRRLPFMPSPRPLVTVIDLNGAIGSSDFGRGISLSKVRSAIEAAFKPDELSAVAISINSPGGSPVQSRLIFSAIRSQADKKKVPVYSFIEDVGASGGYILALAGDTIVADDSSIVGSIGVISSGFGFVDAIGRLGVERRVHTAGSNKSQLDPFKPQDPEDLQRLQSILDDLHEQFVGLVKERRGDKLATEYDDTFSGAFWTAGLAKKRGLIDQIGHLDDFMKTKFGEKVKVKRVSQKRSSLLQTLLGSARTSPSVQADRLAPSNTGDAGVALFNSREVMTTLAELELWSRFRIGR
ncbi:MAG: S49 family peptidase [Pseudomonadota bacterium]